MNIINMHLVFSMLCVISSLSLNTPDPQTTIYDSNEFKVLNNELFRIFKRQFHWRILEFVRTLPNLTNIQKNILEQYDVGIADVYTAIIFNNVRLDCIDERITGLIGFSYVENRYIENINPRGIPGRMAKIDISNVNINDFFCEAVDMHPIDYLAIILGFFNEYGLMLILDNMGITDGVEKLSNVKNIKVLSLFFNKIQYLPDFSEFENLQIIIPDFILISGVVVQRYYVIYEQSYIEYIFRPSL